MANKPIPTTWIVSLTVAAIVVPIALCVVLGTGSLLAVLGDQPGALALSRVALGGGILWAVDLVCLLLAVAVNTLREGSKDEES